MLNGRPDDQTRVVLLDTARLLLETTGPTGLTVRRIAAESGMSTMNVYSRFGGRDGVIDELYSEGFHRLREHVAKHGKVEDPIESFRAPGAAYRDFALANKGFYDVMFAHPIRGYVPSSAARRVAVDGFDELTARMRELMDAGEIDDGDASQVAATHWATCFGHVELEISQVGPAGIDWEASLWRALEALRQSMS
jgi:AcrR family transcriptional regulator